MLGAYSHLAARNGRGVCKNGICETLLQVIFLRSLNIVMILRCDARLPCIMACGKKKERKYHSTLQRMDQRRQQFVRVVTTLNVSRASKRGAARLAHVSQFGSAQRPDAPEIAAADAE